MGLFDGAFGGGTGILPDWLFNPQAMASMPNAMDGGSPAGSFADMWSGVPQGIGNGLLDPQGRNYNPAMTAPFAPQDPGTSFADRWGGVSGMPRMQSVESSPLSLPEMLGGGRMAFGPERPSMNPINVRDSVRDSGSAPQAPQGMPPSGLPPMGQPAQDPGIGGRLQAAGAGFFNAGSPMQAIGNLIGGLVTGERQDPAGMQQQAMKAAVQYVAQAQDIEPGMKQALIQNPAMAVQYLQSKFKGGGSSSDIAEFEYAKRQGYKGTLESWIANKRAGAGEYGLNPIYGVDAQGNPTVMQLGKGGVATQSKLPEGVKISKDPLKLDAGTHWVIMDPVTRQPVATVKKDVAGVARAKEEGEGEGKAAFDLPRVEQNAEQALQTINQIRNHPGKQYSIGVPGIVPGIPGTQQKDFVSLVDQAKGKAFLEAFNSLKGGGQITEVEGKKATDAIARLDRTQSKEGFEQALKDLESVIRIGMARARQQAGKGGASEPPRPDNSDLKKKYGL